MTPKELMEQIKGVSYFTEIKATLTINNHGIPVLYAEYKLTKTSKLCVEQYVFDGKNWVKL